MSRYLQALFFFNAMFYLHTKLNNYLKSKKEMQVQLVFLQGKKPLSAHMIQKSTFSPLSIKR